MRKLLIVPMVAVLAGCGSGSEPPEATRPSEATAMDPLAALCSEEKFLPTLMYAGPDTPEDAPQLVQIVDDAICEIAAMPEPQDEAVVRSRLARLVSDVDLFATEDREQAYRYAVRAWRAAGFTGESRLFPVPDDRVLTGL